MGLKVHFSLYLAPSIIRGVVTLVVIVPLITGYLEASDFGVAALIASILGVFSSLASISPAWVLGSSYYNVGHSEYKKIVFTCAVIDLSLRVLITFLALFLASYILPFIFEPINEIYYLYFTIALLAFCADSFWPLISSMLVIEKNAVIFSFMEIFRIVINLLTVICLLEFADVKQFAFYMPAAISAVLSMLLTLYLLKSRMTMCFDIKLFKRCFKVGLPSIPGNFSEVLTKSTDNFAVQWFGGGLSSVGLYSHSKAYGGMFLMVTKSFFRVFRSEILNVFSNNMKTEQLQSVITNWLYVFAMAGIILALVIEPALNILTNGKLVGASQLVILWYAGMLISFYGYVYTQFLISKEMTSTIMWIQVSVNALSLILLFLGGFLFGFYGVAGGAIIGMFINQVARSMVSQRRGCGVKLLKPLFLSLSLLALSKGLIELGSLDISIRLILTSAIIILITLILLRKTIPESEEFAKLT